jgi:two-component sensor histidine kinase
MLFISVEDSGIGIPLDKQNRIFESFEQADGSIEREYGGTGLGLAVSKQLVELHGGEIGVHSTSGEGSCFFFSLPLVSNTSGIQEKRVSLISNPEIITTTQSNLPRKSIYYGLEKDKTSEEVLHSEMPRILLVDDEAINLQILSNQLKMRNFIVTQVQNGVDALQEIDIKASEGNPYEMVLLDLMMPRMSGYEVCEKIREKYTSDKLPVIMLTAKNRVKDIVVGLRSGANDYLTKPFSKDELLARIDNLKEMHDLAKDRDIAKNIADKSLNEKDILLKEIHHRIKNNLTIIISLLNLQSADYEHEIRMKFIEIINRIHSISLVHEKLYESKDFERINVMDYLSDIVVDIQSSFEITNIEFIFDVDSIFLSLHTMVPCALLITELITNSIKYGNFENKRLKLNLGIKQKDNIIELSFQDNGPGYPKGFDIGQGETLGTTIILSLISQIEGSYKILPPPGAGLKITFPCENSLN